MQIRKRENKKLLMTVCVGPSSIRGEVPYLSGCRRREDFSHGNDMIHWMHQKGPREGRGEWEETRERLGQPCSPGKRWQRARPKQWIAEEGTLGYKQLRKRAGLPGCGIGEAESRGYCLCSQRDGGAALQGQVDESCWKP